MWLRYFKLHLDNDGRSIETLESIDKFIADMVEINISKFRKNNKSYFSSGSLDSSSIKKILQKFSIECNFFEYQLQVIKEDRNFLAHGEKSFTEVSQTKSVQVIESNKDKIISFIEKYIAQIEEYVNQKRYKI